MNIPLISTAEEFAACFKNDFWTHYARTICRRHNISYNRLQRSEHGESVVFLMDDKCVIKIYIPFKNGYKREIKALEYAGNNAAFPTPEILFKGEIENFNYLVTTQIRGVSFTRSEWLNLTSKQQIEFVSHLADGLRKLHSQPVAEIDFDWLKFIERQAATTMERQINGGANAEWLERLPAYLEENLPLLPKDFPPAFVHGDVHFGNLRLTETGGNWRISGLFDFADCLKGFHEYDFVAVGVLMIQGQREIQREFFRAYGYRESEIDETLRRRLMLLTILYEWSSLRRYAQRLKPEAVDYTLDELERGIWAFCE